MPQRLMLVDVKGLFDLANEYKTDVADGLCPDPYGHISSNLHKPTALDATREALGQVREQLSGDVRQENRLSLALAERLLRQVQRILHALEG